jgi:TonB-linked SusC/RagA family outer membrane protein|nr:SusC/RagA family TonB-linked outer membrane protein [Odoribacter splanchnicus]
MKKNRNLGNSGWIRLPQKLLVINLKILFLVCIVNTVSANSFSQLKKLNVDFSGQEITRVLDFLTTQTGYEFVYRKGVLNTGEKVTLELKEVTAEQVLDALLKSRGYDYEIVDQVVVIRKGKTVYVSEAPQVVRVLQGTVRDSGGRPLPGVTVRIKGTTLGVATDQGGRYRLELPAGKDLRILFSFVGMQEQEVVFQDQKVLDITLKEEIAEMEEVIVTGYSTRKVSEMTGAVQQFRGKDIVRSVTGGNLMNALKGHTTGLQITGSTGRPGQDGDLLLRGLGTLYGMDVFSTDATTPLIVIDGVVTDYTTLSGVVASTDVEEITVLKDAASTAIYGSRAATGVIVVTTKKGVKDRMTVTLDVKSGINVPNFGKLKWMTSPELLEYGEMTLRNWWNNNGNLQAKYPSRDQFVQDTLGALRRNFDLTKTTDWRDLMYRNGVTTDVAMSIRGGSDRIRYYFSYNYYNEEGTREKYDLKRHLFKTQLDFDVTKFLTLGVNLRGTIQKNVTPNTSNMEDAHPWLSPYDEDGELKYNIPYWEDFVMKPDPKVNSLLDNRYNDVTDLSSNLFGSFSGVLKPFKWLTLSSTNTFTLLNQNVNDYQDCRTFSGNNFDNYESFGTLKVTDLRSWSFLTSNLLRLKHSFGEHSLNGLVGQEWYERHRRSSELQMYDQNTPGERNVGGFAHQGTKRDQSTIPTGDEAESASFSVFSEVNYNYAGKYMASASFRTDGSTNFGKNNRYGIFWALSASWLVSQERFMEKQHVFSNLKARFSYGTSGKEAGADYLNYTLYRTGMTTFDYYWNHPAYQSTYAAELNQLGNDNLSWETAHNLNIGVDMGFLGNRIALSADWYRRLSTDLIMQVTLPVAYGVGTQYQNVGEMLNRGVELVLNTHNVKSQDFNWRSTFTFSYNDNKLKKLQDSKLDWDGGRTTLYEGDNIDVLKLVKYAGVDAETGNPLLERVEENGSIKLVFMEPGTVLEIDMDNHRWPELTWKGGTRNNDLMKLYARTLPLKREAFEVLKQIYKEGISEEEEKALSEKRMNLLNQAKEETHMFVRSNPASYAAMYLLGGLYNNMELDEYVAVFESFDPELLATSLGREMREKIDIALRTEVGGTAPEFEKKDMNGQMVKLSDYRGKYVLLDFWGSWCSPCRASHPHLREIEAKYAPEGLVVINIASENGKDARETWIKAVKEDKMTWTQILNNEGWEQCDVVKQFAITAFPTKVLIGPDGKILVRTVGESEPIDQKLQEVYGK